MHSLDNKLNKLNKINKKNKLNRQELHPESSSSDETSRRRRIDSGQMLVGCMLLFQFHDCRLSRHVITLIVDGKIIAHEVKFDKRLNTFSFLF